MPDWMLNAGVILFIIGCLFLWVVICVKLIDKYGAPWDD